MNLFSGSPLTAFVLAWDLSRNLCELYPFVGVRDEDSGRALLDRHELFLLGTRSARPVPPSSALLWETGEEEG